MKTKLLILLLAMFTLSNCISDDDGNPEPTSTETTWSLVRVNGGIAGVDQTFDTGLITWTFDSATNMVTVDNNNTDEMLFDILDSGTYSYEIQNDGTNDLMFIDNINYGVITETETEMTFDHQVLDGFILTFYR